MSVMAREIEINSGWIAQIRSLPIVERAKKVALAAHADQYREDGEKPYIVHPENVVNIIQTAGGQGDDLIASAWLHDVVEDTDWSIEDIQDLFGDKVAETVDMLTLHLPRYPKDFPREYRRELKTLALVGKAVKMSSEAKIIKLADRIDNLISAEETWEKSRLQDYAQQAARMFDAMELNCDVSMSQYHVYRELMTNANSIVYHILK